jgi:hypothetical protein
VSASISFEIKELISMAMIEISNLNTAGNDLFADSESFLSELQDTDSEQVFGGKGNSGNKGGHGGYGGKGSKGKGGYGYGGGGKGSKGKGGYGHGGSCYTAD